MKKISLFIILFFFGIVSFVFANTSVIFLLDETGSMGSQKEAVISGFNEYVNSLKEKKDIDFTLVKFNSSKIETVYENKAIACINSLDKYSYEPDDTTPLYDAIAKTIKSVNEKYDKILFVIYTDGLENASKEYKKKDVLEIIKDRQKCDCWKFIYMGSNQDAWSEGESIGISAGNTLDMDGISISDTFVTLTSGTINFIEGNDGDFFKNGKEQK